MFSDVLEAWGNQRVDLARRVRSSDERVDDLQKEIFAWVQSEIPHHTDWGPGVIDVFYVARRLERIGDLSTTIAEEVIFLVEGKVLRHT